MRIFKSGLALKNPPKKTQLKKPSESGFYWVFLNVGFICAQKALKSLLKANKREKKLLGGLKSPNIELF